MKLVVGGILVSPQLFRYIFGSRWDDFLRATGNWINERSRRAGEGWLLNWLVVETVEGRPSPLWRIVAIRTVGQILIVLSDALVAYSIYMALAEGGWPIKWLVLPVFLWSGLPRLVLTYLSAKEGRKRFQEHRPVAAIGYLVGALLVWWTPVVSIWGVLQVSKMTVLPIIGSSVTSGLLSRLVLRVGALAILIGGATKILYLVEIIH